MEKLYKALKVIFNISLNLFMVLGIAIVLVQLLAVVLNNGAMAIRIDELLKLPSIRLSIIAAFSSFFMNMIKSK